MRGSSRITGGLDCFRGCVYPPEIESNEKKGKFQCIRLLGATGVLANLPAIMAILSNKTT